MTAHVMPPVQPRPREHPAIRRTLDELWDGYVVDPVEPRLVDAMDRLG
jgi:hypothetical protein